MFKPKFFTIFFITVVIAMASSVTPLFDGITKIVIRTSEGHCIRKRTLYKTGDKLHGCNEEVRQSWDRAFQIGFVNDGFAQVFGHIEEGNNVGLHCDHGHGGSQ